MSLGKIYNPDIKRRELRCVVKILLIATPHMILHIFYIAIFLLKPMLNPVKPLVIESWLTTAVILLDAWIYVFRFKESRMNLAIYICYFRKDYRDKCIMKRTLLYGTFLERIVPFEEQTNHI